MVLSRKNLIKQKEKTAGAVKGSGGDFYLFSLFIYSIIFDISAK